MKKLEKLDQLSQTMSPILGDLMPYFALAYREGYGGEKGQKAVDKLSKALGDGPKISLTEDRANKETSTCVSLSNSLINQIYPRVAQFDARTCVAMNIEGHLEVPLNIAITL